MPGEWGAPFRSDVDGPSIGPSMTFWGVFDVEGPDCGPSTSLEGPHYVTAGDGTLD